ncbi:PIG-L family deacetylase [Paenibacillus sp. H1-7]|uniref:PIG-L deacetylase family protein n=1 Tax=Paenibacillus sp. H1-7 TaxID=2282849 RepID=UPI001EF925FB|nr:PIG-L family deacetylase [Paenibacillus sp. H1-7]ULL15642.1 PIG-L family deacetylase [Paenibacillus sp. H1-7]
MSRTAAFLFAHPDDETFLCASLISRLQRSGDRTILLLATRGDAGKKNGAVSHLSNEELGALREQEMERAAAIIGLQEVTHLGYPDGKLKEVDETSFVNRVIDYLNDRKPDVAVTFPEDGGNFHPDHMTISKIVTAAVLSGRCPSVQKLYYVASDTLLQSGRLPSVTIDTEQDWPMKAEALRAHQSQIYAIERYFGDLRELPENRRLESFVLAWERGVSYPSKAEAGLFDGIN